MALLRALRLHQWSKNLLLFLPLLLAHRHLDAYAWEASTIGFLSFGLAASSGYLLNDARDVGADRLNPDKKGRPFAAGLLPIRWGYAGAIWLATASLAVGLPLGRGFLLAIAVYTAASWIYSLKLKTIALVDVFMLTSFYVGRIFAGGEASGILISDWFLAFSVFTFLSLAAVKRYAEIVRTDFAQAQRLAYRREDGSLLLAMGVAAGFSASLVFLLYLRSGLPMYTQPRLLWLAFPLFLFWIARVWLMAHRGQMHHDPVVFALRDRSSYVIGLLIVTTMILASL